MIRPYLESDKLILVDILKLNVPKYFDATEVNDFEQYLKNHQDTYLTVLRDGVIIGGAGSVVNVAECSGYIRWIFFHPESTGHGMGGAVLDRCAAILKEDQKVLKIVAETSQLAYNFFEKNGFELINTQKDHWGKGLDLYLMEKKV